MLGVPIDRYYLRFEQNEDGHDHKTIVMINYRDKIAQNPYERMQSLKRHDKGKKRQSPTRRMDSAKTSNPKFLMHASVAEVGMREQTIPLSPGVSSYNGSNLNTLLYGEVPIQVFPSLFQTWRRAMRFLIAELGILVLGHRKGTQHFSLLPNQDIKTAGLWTNIMGSGWFYVFNNVDLLKNI